jgi:uncharacterized spore protein YtfJ
VKKRALYKLNLTGQCLYRKRSAKSFKSNYMPDQNFIEKLASGFQQSASVKNIFGEPIIAGDKTIIPVARIAYGLGGGFGQGKKNKKHGDSNAITQEDQPIGEGAGGGGGMYARAKGVYEITPGCTRFIPVDNTRQIIAGICIGFLLHTLLVCNRRS